VRTGGAFTGRARPTILRTCALLAAILTVLALEACGNAATGPEGSNPPNNLITRAEVDKAKRGGVEQAFLEYWSALQFQAWTEAASYFDPAFRRFVGTASIIDAKRINAPSYPDLKPTAVSITSHRGLTTIRYDVWLSEGTKELASVTWRKVGGNWQIFFESRLDAELNQLGTNEVEIRRHGVLPTEASQISPAAARAGYKLSRLQAQFAERELDLEAP
jgi:hypothetical protein